MVHATGFMAAHSWGLGALTSSGPRRPAGAEVLPHLGSPVKRGASCESYDLPSVEFLISDAYKRPPGLDRTRRGAQAAGGFLLPALTGGSHASAAGQMPIGYSNRFLHRAVSNMALGEDAAYGYHMRPRAQMQASTLRESRRCSSMTQFNFGNALQQNPGGWDSWQRPCAAAGYVSTDVGEKVVEPSGSTENMFRGAAPIAQALVQQCGSLERAFATLDYNHKGKVTRSQWETGLALLHLNCGELCGISSKAVFKMMNTFDGKHKREVTLDAWRGFFAQLEGTSDAELLTEDNGPRRPKPTLGRSADRSGSLVGAEATLGRSADRSGSLVGAEPTLRRSADRSGSLVGAEPTLRRSADRSGSLVGAGTAEDAYHCDGRRSIFKQDQRRTGNDSFDPGGKQGCHEIEKNSGHENAENGYNTSFRGARRQRTGELDRKESGECGLAGGANSFARGAASRSLEEKRGQQSSRSVPSATTRCNEVVTAYPVDAAYAPAKRSNVTVPEDLRGLSIEELSGLAEQKQLAEELLSLSLGGVKALAYVILAKLHTFKKAFRWFDTNRKGHFAHVSWDTGVRLLRINMEELTGFQPSDIFAMIDVDPRDGHVSMKEWTSFFDAVDTGDLVKHLEKLRKRHGALPERSAAKLQQLREQQAEQIKKIGPVSNRDSGNSTIELELSTGSGSSPRTAELDVMTAPEENCSMSVGDDGRKAFQKKKKRRQSKAPPISHSMGCDHPATINQSFGETDTSMQSETIEADAERDTDESSDGEQSSGSCQSMHENTNDPESSFVADGRNGKDEEDSLSCEGDGLAPLDDSDDESESEFPSGYEQTFRQRIRSELSQLGPGGCLEYEVGYDSLESSIIQEVAEELGLWSHAAEELQVPLSARGGTQCKSTGEWPNVVLVCNLKEFAEDTREKLLGIQPGEHLEFPSALTEEQRRVVHILAASLGLWTHSEGKGAERRVVAFNLGEFTDEIRRQLEALPCGESMTFPDDFSAAQVRLVRMIACELNYWVETPRAASGCCTEVFNFADFTQSVRMQLTELKPGEQRDFAPELTEQQRKIVRSIAAELDLVSSSSGEGPNRIVSVAHLREFREEVRMMLRRLGAGQRRQFPASLSMLQRKVVHETAAEMGLPSESIEDGDERFVAVTRPGGQSTSTDGINGLTKNAKQRGDNVYDSGYEISEGDAEDDNDTGSNCGREGLSEASAISKIFHAYATGCWNGETIFLRFPDLREFSEDAKDALPNKFRLFLRFRDDLESIFDDTLQLQIDMGTRSRKGLTLKWFQVFIQKAMRKLGVGCVGILLSLISERR